MVAGRPKRRIPEAEQYPHACTHARTRTLARAGARSAVRRPAPQMSCDNRPGMLQTPLDMRPGERASGVLAAPTGHPPGMKPVAALAAALTNAQSPERERERETATHRAHGGWRWVCRRRRRRRCRGRYPAQVQRKSERASGQMQNGTNRVTYRPTNGDGRRGVRSDDKIDRLARSSLGGDTCTNRRACVRYAALRNAANDGALSLDFSGFDSNSRLVRYRRRC